MKALPILTSLSVAAVLAPQLAFAQVPTSDQPLALRPDQQQFFDLYKEMVETDTTLSAGSCTQAAEQVATRLRAAGYGDGDITLFSVPDHPREGGIVAVLPGTSRTARPILLLAHLDVVEAKREDWTRDPFRLVEEGGYYYARGAADDKAMAATWADLLIRFRTDGYRPARTIKVALTCGEETTYAFNGAQWLAENRPELIAAEFALNEGGGGDTDGHGRIVAQTMQVGEKSVQNFRIETTSPGGHSSIPVRENAIYELADALVKIREHEFPAMLTDTTRTYFRMTGTAIGGEMGQALTAIAADPNDAAADRIVSRDRNYHSMLRTTCVATLLDGGHANNALPQRAGANINCRIFPGQTIEQTQAALVAAIGDAHVTIAQVPPIRPLAVPPPLDPRIMKPAQALVARYFPGVALTPVMSTGATDGIFLEAIGIPVYGIPGIWFDPDGNGAHGLNERIEVRAVMTGRDFMFDLVKAYAAMR